MKIFEAAVIVLSDSGEPMHVKAIYDEIIKKELFKFGAKDPVSVLSKTLSKKSKSSDGVPNPEFVSVGGGIYGLNKKSK